MSDFLDVFILISVAFIVWCITTTSIDIKLEPNDISNIETVIRDKCDDNGGLSFISIKDDMYIECKNGAVFKNVNYRK